jgi:hypothetical protein
MSYFEDPYTGPDRRRHDDLVEWPWPRDEPIGESLGDILPPESEALPPETERTLDDLHVPVVDGTSQTKDETRKLHRRLEIMGVEDPRSLSRRKVLEFGSLIFAAYSLEDIHYESPYHKDAIRSDLGSRQTPYISRGQQR